MPLQSWKEAVEASLPRLVPAQAPEALREAMLYSLMAGGKRFRPLLILASARALGADPLPLADAACAVEFIHTYSLIHDDLPAMDNDTLRRGMPTSHVRFGEALAILAGDALNTEAFRILAEHPPGAGAATRLETVRLMAEAAGPEGMAGGQVLDMRAAPDAGEDALLAVHTGKTARLIQVCFHLGSLYAGAPERTLEQFNTLGLKAGLLFQIADDILDETSTAAEMGKSPAKDRAQDKLTAPRVWGLDDAILRARRLESDITAEVGRMGPPAEPLCELLRWICGKIPDLPK
jgi:geranylgeranyl diphosphate synthase, type II